MYYSWVNQYRDGVRYVFRSAIVIYDPQTGTYQIGVPIASAERYRYLSGPHPNGADAWVEALKNILQERTL